MPTAVILAPLVLMLVLPGALVLLAGRLLRRRFGVPASRRGRVGRAVAAMLLGAVAAVPLLALVVWAYANRPGWLPAAPRGSLAEADSFVVFNFGVGPTVGGRPTPGESNRALARWLVEHNPARKPTVVQDALYYALEELAADRPGLLDGGWLVRLSDRPDVYVDTMGAAYQAETVLHLRGLTRPVLVSHDQQLQRMAWSFDAVGVRDYVVPEMPPTPFDPASVQHAGTRWEAAWRVRELFFARPVTLRPQATIVVVGVIALASGWGLRRVLP